MDRQSDIAAIVGVIQAYFDGLFHADSARLKMVFHVDARYVNTVDGDFMNFSVSEYFDVVDQRQSPASQKQPRHDEILAIEFGGPGMAFIKLKMSMMGRDYLDFLTLIVDQGRWQIIAKVFDYQQQK